jgi:hypothetical protein
MPTVVRDEYPQWQVECDQRRSQHQRRAALRISKNDDLSVGHAQTDPAGRTTVIEAGEDLELPPFQGAVEPSERVRKSVRACTGYDAIGVLRSSDHFLLLAEVNEPLATKKSSSARSRPTSPERRLAIVLSGEAPA